MSSRNVYVIPWARFWWWWNLLLNSKQVEAAKVFDKETASPPHMDSAVVFARWRQCAFHVIHASLGPPESTPQTASRSIQPFFARLTTVTDRPTDRPYSVCNNSPHLVTYVVLRCGLITAEHFSRHTLALYWNGWTYLWTVVFSYKSCWWKLIGITLNTVNRSRKHKCVTFEQYVGISAETIQDRAIVTMER